MIFEVEIQFRISESNDLNKRISKVKRPFLACIKYVHWLYSFLPMCAIKIVKYSVLKRDDYWNCVSVNLNPFKTIIDSQTTTCTRETCTRHFEEILNWSLQNFSKHIYSVLDVYWCIGLVIFFFFHYIVMLVTWPEKNVIKYGCFHVYLCVFCVKFTIKSLNVVFTKY